MPTKIKLWEVKDDIPMLLPKSKLNLEARLEKWILKDVSLISDDLLIIGQQVATDYGGFIDLLAIDSDGNLVILELKRDKTPRDIVAQVLDYASWIETIGASKIEEISKDFLNVDSLEDVFRNKFKKDLPEVLNERHRMYIVASELDASSERIVKYLSENHNVDINVATFNYFNVGEQEFIGRIFLLDEVAVETRATRSSKRKPPLSWEELGDLADKHGVKELFSHAIEQFKLIFDSHNRSRSTVSFICLMGENKARNAMVSIYPGSSDVNDGLVIGVSIERITEYYSIQQDKLIHVLGSPYEKSEAIWANETYLFDREKLDNFVTLIKEAAKA